MIDGIEDGTEPLELAEEQVVEFAEEQVEAAPEETIVSFADEPEEGVEETPLIKQLRTQQREMQREIRRLRQGAPVPANDADPEPVIPPTPTIEGCEYDQDRLDRAIEERDAAKESHMVWKARQSERVNQRRRAEEDQAKQIEQQKRALGVSDYDARSEAVRERLNDAQMAVLINGADNPAQMIYALGRAQNRLDLLAGEENLAKFAVMLGKMERDIKVQKRKAPEPETRVRGATASISAGDDKELARLEAEADRTNDRSKVIAYKRSLRAA